MLRDHLLPFINLDGDTGSIRCHQLPANDEDRQHWRASSICPWWTEV